MSVNNITSKILRDAEGRKESILATAEEEKNKISHRGRALEALNKKLIALGIS